MGKLKPPIAGFMSVSDIQFKLGQAGSGGEQSTLRWQRWGINPSKVEQLNGKRVKQRYWYSPTRVRMLEKLYAKYGSETGKLPPLLPEMDPLNRPPPTPRKQPRAHAMFPPQLMSSTTMENHLARLVTQNDKIIELLIELKGVWK